MKLRIQSVKLGKVRYVSHRDAARIWERAFRRADVAVAATEGFTPRPKISFGLALPTGAESVAEYLDVELHPSIEPGDLDLINLPSRLSAALPRGFEVFATAEWNHKGSLQQDVTSCTWELWSPHLSAEHHRQARRLLDESTLMITRERKGKEVTDDVRPLIIDIRAGDNAVSQAHTHQPLDDRLIVDLATVGRALRPSEFAELAYPEHDARDLRALRIHQWIDGDGQRREVLEQHTPRANATASPEAVLA